MGSKIFIKTRLFLRILQNIIQQQRIIYIIRENKVFFHLNNLCFMYSLANNNKITTLCYVINNYFITSRKLNLTKNFMLNLIFYSMTKIHFCKLDNLSRYRSHNFHLNILELSSLNFEFGLGHSICTTLGGGIIVISYSGEQDTVFRLTINQKMVQCKKKNRVYLSRIFLSIICQLENNVILNTNPNLRLSKKFDTVSLNQHIPFLKSNFWVKRVKNKILKKLLYTCLTFDQTKCLLFILGINTVTQMSNTISIISPRGRGKSSLLGLLTTIALLFGHTKILTTSALLSNLNVIFQLNLFTLKQIGLKEKEDFIVYYDKYLHTKSIRICFRHHPMKNILYYYHIKNRFEKISDLLIVDEENLELMLDPSVWDNHKNLIISLPTWGFYSMGSFVPSNYLFYLKTKLNTKTNFLFSYFSLITPLRYDKRDELEKWSFLYVKIKPLKINLNIITKKFYLQNYKIYILNLLIFYSCSFSNQKTISQIISLFSMNTNLMSYESLFHYISYMDFLFLFTTFNKLWKKNYKIPIFGIVTMCYVKHKENHLSKDISNLFNRFNSIIPQHLIKTVIIQDAIVTPNIYTHKITFPILKSFIRLFLKFYTKKHSKILKVIKNITMSLQEFLLWSKLGFTPILINYQNFYHPQLTSIEMSRYLTKEQKSNVVDLIMTIVRDVQIIYAINVKYCVQHLSPVFILFYYRCLLTNLHIQKPTCLKLTPNYLFSLTELVRIEIYLYQERSFNLIKSIIPKLANFYLIHMRITKLNFLESIILILFGIKKKNMCFTQRYLKTNKLVIHYTLVKLIGKLYSVILSLFYKGGVS